MRQERVELARALRSQGMSWTAISGALRLRYRVNARVAMRLAHGWAQADAAAEWNHRWPDDPKTSKNFSYWENWPSSTGYRPSLTTLDRLAELYSCNVSDLLIDWGMHAEREDTVQVGAAVSSAVLSWQLEHLPVSDLVGGLLDWSAQLSEDQRRAQLLKVSTAAAIAANETAPERSPTIVGAAPSLGELAGIWDSVYRYFSTGRGAELTGEHRIGLTVQNGRLVGRSEPTDTGTVELELVADGQLVTGTWTECTAPAGYYRGAVYHGIVQLVLDPVGRSMTGRWIGPDKHFTINSGPWQLTRSV